MYDTGTILVQVLAMGLCVCVGVSIYQSCQYCIKTAAQIDLVFCVLVFTALRYAKRGICHRRVSVCVCVCMCVCHTPVLYQNGWIMYITPHDSPMTLVFLRQRSWRNSNGITPYGGDKCRWGGLKLVTFDEKCAITRKRYKIDV